MNKKQRAQVVELLRCAADLRLSSHGAVEVPVWHAAQAITRNGSRVHGFALDATFILNGQGYDLTTRHLEAAARVEEGSWP